MKRQVAQFLNYMVNEKNCSANTAAAYQNDLSQFLDYLKAYSRAFCTTWSTPAICMRTRQTTWTRPR